MAWILRTKPRRLNCHNIIIIFALARFAHSAFFPTRVELVRLLQMQTGGAAGAAICLTYAPGIQAAGRTSF